MKTMHIFCPLCEKKTLVDFISHYNNQNPLFEERDLYQCPKCELIFVHPVPTREELDLYYKTVWTTSDEAGIVYQIQAEERVRYIARHMRLDKDAEILDLGAGHGLLYEAFRQQGFGTINFFATDPSPENLVRLKKRGIPCYSDIAGLGDRKFDLITICFVLEHVPDPVQFLNGILSHVKPGGYVFIDLPERDDTFKPLLEPHVTVFSDKSLKALADKLELSVIHMIGYGQTRENLIAEEKRNYVSKLLRHWYTGMISRIYPALYPGRAEEFQRKMLFDIYRFNEEGPDRWWIRTLLKKP